MSSAVNGSVQGEPATGVPPDDQLFADDPGALRLVWIAVFCYASAHHEWRSALEAFRNALRKQPPIRWKTGAIVIRAVYE